jgi:uncharacterized protein YecT (DUF1311 family)
MSTESTIQMKHLVSWAIISIVAFFSLLRCDVARADSEEGDNVDPCIKEGGGIMYCQGASILEDNRKIDTDLNATYKTLRNRLHGNSLERNLVVAERKWIRDRDKRCRELSEDGFVNDNDKNAAHQAIAVAFQSCIQGELRSRLEFLQAALLRLNKEGLEKFRL